MRSPPPLLEGELEAWTDRARLAALIDTFAAPGPGVADELRTAARALVRDDRASSFEAMSAARFILPSATDAELVAPQLGPAERARYFASTSVLVLRLRGPGGPPHWVARTGLGLAAALAERLGGFVDDEVRRRVETAALGKARMPPLELRSAFADDAITVELDPAEDAGAPGRLLTLGNKRFGAPDLELRDVVESQAEALARVLTNLARIASARVLPTEPRELRLETRELWPDGAVTGEPYRMRLAPAAMSAGNPENELLEVLVDDAMRARLVRDATLVPLGDGGLHAESEAEFVARLAGIGKLLPGVAARWKKEHGTLFLLVDFPAEQGAVEAMWVETTRLDAGRVQGTLANEPAHVLGLHHGDPVDVPNATLSGYRLELPSGEHVAFP